MAERIITCTNEDGVSMTFDESSWAPYIIAKAEGIYAENNNIYLSNNTMIDGAEYQGTVAAYRNIVLTLKEKDPDKYAENRDALSILFDKSQLGTMVVQEADHRRQINYCVENINTTATPKTRLTTVSLLCPDPYFYDPYESRVYIADIQDMFEFPHEFIEEGEEFSFINDDKVAIIRNIGTENNMGLTVTLTCASTVVNPSVTKIETGEKMQIGTDEKPFELYAEDMVVVTTHTGHKNILLVRDGETIDINEYMSYDSVFFQLARGKNTFGCNAVSGLDYLGVKLTYRYKYARA